MRTEDSVVSGEHQAPVEADEDFQYLQSILADKDSNWEVAYATDKLQVQKKKGVEGTAVFLRCQALLPKINKNLAFQAYADIKLRKKWDVIPQNLKVIENDEEKGTFVMYYQIKTPPFVQTRDALVQVKAMKGFPYDGALAVHHKSVTHPECPEDPTKFIRVDQSIFGLVFEDAPEVMGTKLSFVIHNDLKGSIPRTVINARAVKNPKLMMDNLIQAC